MEAFVKLTGIAAPLMRPNIDTDQIIAGTGLMQVKKSGFGKELFGGWRYLYTPGQPRIENPDFVLNQEAFRKARFLVAGPNFGCGSSREFAVWAVRDFGLKCVIAASFGAIFYANCFHNGILPIVLPVEVIEGIAADLNAGQLELSVDLERNVLIDQQGREHAFKIPALPRTMLLGGLDAVEATLTRAAQITAYQDKDRARRPWVYGAEANLNK